MKTTMQLFAKLQSKTRPELWSPDIKDPTALCLQLNPGDSQQQLVSRPQPINIHRECQGGPCRWRLGPLIL